MIYKNINVVTKFSFLRREQSNFKVSSHHYKNLLVVMLFTYLFIYTYLYWNGGRLEVFCRKDVLKISQNSQESICARASFLIKLLIIGLRLRDMFSWEFCKFFNNAFFYRTLPVTPPFYRLLCVICTTFLYVTLHQKKRLVSQNRINAGRRIMFNPFNPW